MAAALFPLLLILWRVIPTKRKDAARLGTHPRRFYRCEASKRLSPPRVAFWLAVPAWLLVMADSCDRPQWLGEAIQLPSAAGSDVGGRSVGQYARAGFYHRGSGLTD